MTRLQAPVALRPAPYQYPFRAAIEGASSSSSRRAHPPCSTPVVTPLTAAQLALQMAEEVEAQSAVNGRFFKTRMCLFHQKGACVKGSGCSYAHCESELRPAPDLMKTRLCQDWLNGNCTSHVCKFAHGRHELRFTHDFYKTKICHFWQQGGCTKGVFCRHAHGAHELRPTVDSDNEEVPNQGSRSSTRSSNRSCSPRAADNTAAVFEALRLASEARKLVERGAELLMQSEAAPRGGATPLARRLGHRSQPSCASERLAAKLSAPNSPLPPYGTAGSGLTVTTAAPSLAATYTGGHSTPTHGMHSPELTFSMPETSAQSPEDLGLVDQLLESLILSAQPPPPPEDELAEAISSILNGWEESEKSQW